MGGCASQARASLCCLWNLARPAERRLEVAEATAAVLPLAIAARNTGKVPHGEIEKNDDWAYEEVRDWAARLAWLLAEVPVARSALGGHIGGLAVALRAASSDRGCTGKWARRALKRL